MCVQTKCVECGVPAKSCSLVNGKCYVCRSKPPKPAILGTPPISTPPNNYSDVYHTN